LEEFLNNHKHLADKPTMKIKHFIVLLYSFFLFNEAHASNLRVNELLNTIGVTKFNESIKRIKKYNSVEEIDELDYELKWYYSNLRLWYYFDGESFARGLRGKLEKNFSNNEIREINKVFQKPFNIKVLNALALRRDVFRFNHQSVLTDEKTIPLLKSRYSLMKNIYKLHGMSIQKELIEKRQSDFVLSGRTIVTIFSKKDGSKHFVNPSELKKRMEKAEEYFITSLGTDLSSFRHYELREYIRVMKKSVTVQKFLQLYVNYFYLYLTEYMSKIEQDKVNAIKILDNPPEKKR
jgi:hypothetical protein